MLHHSRRRLVIAGPNTGSYVGRIISCRKQLLEPVGCDDAGDPGPKNLDAEARAVEAASLAYFRNRASAPRDLSANACQQLRDACVAVLQDAY